jgi:hypothetical protein
VYPRPMSGDVTGEADSGAVLDTEHGDEPHAPRPSPKGFPYPRSLARLYRLTTMDLG